MTGSYQYQLPFIEIVCRAASRRTVNYTKKRKIQNDITEAVTIVGPTALQWTHALSDGTSRLIAAPQ